MTLKAIPEQFVAGIVTYHPSKMQETYQAMAQLALQSTTPEDRDGTSTNKSSKGSEKMPFTYFQDEVNSDSEACEGEDLPVEVVSRSKSLVSISYQLSSFTR